MLKGAIFDLDGLLVDTESLQWQGWREVLKPFGISLSEKDYLKYAGKAGTIIEAELIKDYNLNIEKGSLLKRKEDLLLRWLRVKSLKTFPFAKKAIKLFKKFKIKVAVVSGGPRNEVEFKLKKIRLYSLVDVIISGSDIKRGKPNPDIYLLGVEKLNLKPKDCISFEDTEHGVKSAKLAGLICVSIPNEFSKKQNFSKADAKFDNLREATDWVKKIIIGKKRF
jgi:HAD superfamily hydrolase (TIGR01509 family)